MNVLPERHQVLDTFEEDPAQRDTAERPRRMRRRLAGSRQIDGEQRMELMVEESDAGADL